MLKYHILLAIFDPVCVKFMCKGTVNSFSLATEQNLRLTYRAFIRKMYIRFPNNLD